MGTRSRAELPDGPGISELVATAEMVEKRCEPRERASGPVRLRPDHGPKTMEVAGRLIDWSRNGFRAAHNCRFLQTGDIVEFQHEQGAGLARVVWIRISADGVDAGFVVVSHA